MVFEVAPASEAFLKFQSMQKFYRIFNRLAQAIGMLILVIVVSALITHLFDLAGSATGIDWLPLALNTLLILSIIYYLIGMVKSSKGLREDQE